jgi:hypothetical protein
MIKIINFLKTDNLRTVRLLCFFSFVIAMLMTPNLWFTNRLFPLISLIDNLYLPNRNIDLLLLFIFILSFFMFVVKPKWIFSFPIISVYLYWCLLDQNRLQHYFFELIFVVFSLSMINNESTLNCKKCLLWIFIATYFWSGVHKFNDVFFEKWLNGLNKRIPFVPYWMRVLFTYSVPFLEASFGLMLLFIKTRKIGVFLIGIMHLIILITFIKGNFGYTVIPLMFFNVFTLFFVFYNSTFIFKDLFTNNNFQIYFIYVLIIFLPFTNFLGIYDHLLSFSYFSGKPKYARIVFNDMLQINDLPPHINSFVREYNGTYYLDLNEWSANSIAVMVYPEMRVYLKINNHVKSYLNDKNIHLVFY